MTASGAENVHARVETARLARAKVNYALHVTGRRADGYHLLESLVAFPELGDRLTLTPGTRPGSDAAAGPGLTAAGRFAADLGSNAGGEDNLALRALRALDARLGAPAAGYRLHLEKDLPVASGIGGGSADAAAALLLGFELRTGRVPDAPDLDMLAALALQLGADIPMCLASRPALVTGIGERIAPLARFPAHAILLVNPGIAVPTPAVFSRLDRRDNPPLPPTGYTGFADFDHLVGWLGETRNDLQDAAISLAPEIGDVLALLRRQDGVRLARMSGSGATCFALLETLAAAHALADEIGARHPHWWVIAAPVGSIAPSGD
ncbi:4-(cytidine 5'-diphospho)-2-C-methyl-D-erythritol kinase [Stappia sp.]|uniref:4-(cytidine 5'-diphospho)-2-C-methyl-D-erythritol kinase n=1 Tax=Stappia sp. TaxID=1870903 RepID=UPI003A98E920